jgi:hypothetical protein
LFVAVWVDPDPRGTARVVLARGCEPLALLPARGCEPLALLPARGCEPLSLLPARGLLGARGVAVAVAVACWPLWLLL